MAGFVAAVGLVLASVFLATVAARLYARWYPDPRRYPLAEYLLPSSAPYAIVVLVLIAFVFALSYRWVAPRAGPTELGLGFLVLWLAFATAGLAMAPVGVYLFQWPLLAACAAWLWVLRGLGRNSFFLIVPGATAALLLAPQLLLAYFGDGVAGLPDLALVGSLAVGLIAPALTGLPSEQTAPLPDVGSQGPVADRGFPATS